VLILKPDFLAIAEVNPPTLPDHSHRSLAGTWRHVLITDNVFGKIRVSPYAYGARITHDVPNVHPTVVVSSRDRNVLAIESEVRGALGNGVDSFLVVSGDSFPAVPRSANPERVTEHLRSLQSVMPAFEVGTPTRFDRANLDRRIGAGAQFLITAPVLDSLGAAISLAQLGLTGDEPPIYVAVIPPFSPAWIARAEGWGAVPTSSEFLAMVEVTSLGRRRRRAWEEVDRVRLVAQDAGAAGIVLMGLKFDTLVGEAAGALHPDAAA
jgi:5,10-methylenetetrahydrofolate reductase